MNVALGDLPTWGIVVIGVLVVAQLALTVTAVVDLVRRPVERVAGGNKWLWVAVILLVNTIGAILYLALGRRPAPAVDPVAGAAAPGTSAARAASVADSLYGQRPGTDAR